MSEQASQVILLCDMCDGHGVTGQSELEDYHKGEYKYWNVVCQKCKGSGRLLQTTVTTLGPYDNSEVTLLLLKDTNT